MSTTQSNQVTPGAQNDGLRRLPARVHARAGAQIGRDVAAGPVLTQATPRPGADPHLLQDLTVVLDWLGQPGSRQPVR